MLGKPKILIILFSALIVAYGLLGGLLDRVSARDIYGQLSIFTDVLRKLKNDYVEEPDMQEALDGALQGMVEALDPYSSFVSAGTYEKLISKYDDPASPGLFLAKRYAYVVVVAVVPGSPAARAGLRTGDVLESIEDVVTSSMSLWEANARLRGEAGTSISLRVIRNRRGEPSEITLSREVTPTPKVRGHIADSGIGVLEIPSFEPGTAKEVSAQLKMLQAGATKGVILDLRDNAVGTVQEAIKAAELFLNPGKTILVRRDREGTSSETKAETPAVFDLPRMVLLVDAGTSGPAEIFSAALKDNELAELIGEKTNGWGAEHAQFRLADGSLLVLATELYYRPSGEPIQGETVRSSGLNPDRRSPSNTFVSNFYFDNVTDNMEDGPGEEFYIRLDQAIEEQQMQDAIAALQETLKKAA